jgi:hypothetical protein
VSDAIETTDWAAIPGFAKFYNPDAIAPALRDLASATNPVRAAEAAGSLASGGLLHEHSGGTHPAVVAAAPILLEIIEHAHPAARPAALGLLEDAILYDPYWEYTTVATADGPDIPLCCAVAATVRSRRPLLAGLGRPGKQVLTVADQHWRFTVHEAVDGPGAFTALALGSLEGEPVLPARPCDLRCPGQPATRLSAVITAADPVPDADGRTYLVITGLEPQYPAARRHPLAPVQRSGALDRPRHREAATPRETPPIPCSSTMLRAYPGLSIYYRHATLVHGH